jgi:hypothetical protein
MSTINISKEPINQEIFWQLWDSLKDLVPKTKHGRLQFEVEQIAQQLNKAGLEARINEWDNFLKFELSANGRIATLKQQLKDKGIK